MVSCCMLLGCLCLHCADIMCYVPDLLYCNKCGVLYFMLLSCFVPTCVVLCTAVVCCSALGQLLRHMLLFGALALIHHASLYYTV